MNAKKLTLTPRIQENKKSIVIIQLTRLGDLLQTMIACRPILEQKKEIQMTLVAREQFARPILFLLNIVFHKVILINRNEITNNDSIESCLDSMQGTLNKVNYTHHDIAINLSFCGVSTNLNGLVKSTFKIGPHRDLMGNVSISDRWSQYLYSNVIGTSLSPFNLVDLFKLILGIELKPHQYSFSLTSKKHLGKKVLIHPFSSTDKKSWGKDRWIEVIYNTLKNHPASIVYITGAVDDLEDSIKIERAPILTHFSNRLVNLTGKHDVEELFEFLKDIDLFIGNDSMVSHLASLHKTNSVVLALGSVKQNESHPYNENCIVLSPKTSCFPCTVQESCQDFKCHRDIGHHLVSDVINHVLKFGMEGIHAKIKNIPGFKRSNTLVSKVEFSKDTNMSYLTAIDGEYFSTPELFKLIYRVSWLYALEEKEEDIAIPNFSAQTNETILFNLKGIEYLYELSEFGKKYSKYILEELTLKSPSLVKIKNFSKKIDEIDHLQLMIKKTYPLLSPIVNYFTLQKANLAGSNIREITESSYLSFNDYSLFLSVTFELFDKIAVKQAGNIKANRNEETNKFNTDVK